MSDVLVISWVLSGFTCLNIWLLGRLKREGFVVGLAAQPIWLVFDWWVGAYGLMPLAIVLGWLYVKGWRNWGRLHAVSGKGVAS